MPENENFRRGASLAIDDFDDDMDIEVQRVGQVRHLLDTRWRLINSCLLRILNISSDQQLKVEEINQYDSDIKEYIESEDETYKERYKELKNSFYTCMHVDPNICFYVMYDVSKIIYMGDKNGFSSLSSCDDSQKYWMNTLLKSIPIKLVDKEQMPTPKIPGDLSMEVLGYYVSKDNDTKKPLIGICPEKIKLIASKHSIDARLLYAVVLIHELAHAAMDDTNTPENIGKDKTKGKVLSDRDVAMEESLANMITLQYFEVAKHILGKDDYEKVRDFVNKQPSAYKFGITQYEIMKPDWRDWRNNNVCNILENWANRMNQTKENPTL